MKGYEYVSRTHLPRRIPAIIRLDGKAFHTFTRGLEKPFDRVMVETMQKTMKYLCENIQGCVLGYTQSDEITLVLTDYENIKTDAWFSYNIQKMASISASMATLAFNRFFDEYYYNVTLESIACQDKDKEESLSVKAALLSRKRYQAMFDARVFSIPREEICNCLIWRQQDAVRNSIEAVGQANFSNKQLHKKNCDQIRDMLCKDRGIDWNDFPTDCKSGACCTKKTVSVTADNPVNPGEQITYQRRRWEVDHETPIFSQKKDYINRLL